MRPPPSYLRLLAALALAVCAAAAGLLGWSYLRIERALAGRSRIAPAETRPSALERSVRDRQIAQARRLLDAADFPGAAAALDRALEAIPGDPEALALQVRALRGQRLYTAARSSARRILDSFPQSPLPNLLLGSIALQEGDPVTARADLERAASLDTSSALPVAQLAALDLLEGRVDQARGRARQALALEPDDVGALRILSRTTRAVPDLIAIYERLVDIAPGETPERAWLETLRAGQGPEVNYFSPLAGETTVVCEKDEEGRLFVRAGIDSLAGLRLLVDTGASGLVLKESIARRLGMRLREFTRSAGVGGLTSHSHPILVDRFALGGLRARELMATASNLPAGMDGILNPLLLAPPGGGVVAELSASPARLIFRPASAERPADPGWVTVPFLADGYHVIFRVVLGGLPAMALLDTGASVDLVDRSLLRRLPAHSVAPAGASGATLLGFGGLIQDAEMLQDVALRIAGHEFVSRHFFVVDLNDEAFRFQVDLDAVVGMERLRAFDIRIDPGAGQISFRLAAEHRSLADLTPAAR